MMRPWRSVSRHSLELNIPIMRRDLAKIIDKTERILNEAKNLINQGKYNAAIELLKKINISQDIAYIDNAVKTLKEMYLREYSIERSKLVNDLGFMQRILRDFKGAPSANIRRMVSRSIFYIEQNDIQSALDMINKAAQIKGSTISPDVYHKLDAIKQRLKHLLELKRLINEPLQR